MEEVVEEEEEVAAVFEGGGQEITISQFNQFLFSYGPHKQTNKRKGEEKRMEERGVKKEGRKVRTLKIFPSKQSRKISPPARCTSGAPVLATKYPLFNAYASAIVNGDLRKE